MLSLTASALPSYRRVIAMPRTQWSGLWGVIPYPHIKCQELGKDAAHDRTGSGYSNFSCDIRAETTLQGAS